MLHLYAFETTKIENNKINDMKYTIHNNRLIQEININFIHFISICIFYGTKIFNKDNFNLIFNLILTIYKNLSIYMKKFELYILRCILSLVLINFMINISKIKKQNHKNETEYGIFTIFKLITFFLFLISIVSCVYLCAKFNFKINNKILDTDKTKLHMYTVQTNNSTPTYYPESKYNYKIPDTILTECNNTNIWEITEPILEWNKKITQITLMADTGASLCAINAEFARKHFPSSEIKNCKNIPCKVAGNGILELTQYVDITFVNPTTHQQIITIEFYLIPGLMYNYLASLYLIRKLNWKFIKDEHTAYTHEASEDESFGSCNNWDDNNFHVAMPHKTERIHYMYSKNDTPYQYYLNQCTTFQAFGTQLNTITRVHDGTSDRLIEPKFILNISNFQASEKEIEKAKKLTHDRLFKPINLEHLRQRSMKLYNRMQYLCNNKYKHVWAQHQFHISELKNRVFKIELKDEYKDKKIYMPQYHLNEDKRLVALYHTMKNIENGLFEPNYTSIHNVPMIVVKKKKDSRLRPAYDLRKLNSVTKDMKAHIPSYNYLFELLRGKGLFTVSDMKNFFENIPLRKSDTDLVTVTTPLGRYNLTRATYGFKNIATYAQEISNDLVNNLGRCGAFIDDVFIKHTQYPTDDELLDQAEQFFERVSDLGTLLHPEKTYFFVPEVEFLGYIFNQQGHRPHKKYINKILNLGIPRTKKQLRAFIGLVQYIARYVHQLHEWTYWLSFLTRDNLAEKPSDESIKLAVHTLKDKVSKIKLLYHPTDDGTFLVQTDASKHAIGAVLYQRQFDRKIKKYQWKIIEFFSKQIDRHLIQQPIMVKECLAISYACNHWKHFLLRKKFYIDTDHKNLIAMFDPDDAKAPKMSQKQIFATLRNAISMFHFELAHSPGTDLVLADWLSREGNKTNDIGLNTEIISDIMSNKTNNKNIQYIKNNITKKYTNKQINNNNIHTLYYKPFQNKTIQTKYKNMQSQIKNLRKTAHFNINLFQQNINMIENIKDISSRYDKNKITIDNIDLTNFNIHYINTYGYITPHNRININKNEHIMINKMKNNTLTRLMNHKLQSLNKQFIHLIRDIQNNTINKYNSRIRIDYTINDILKTYQIYTINKKIPNYNTNEQMIRKSTRPRVKPVQFWNQKTLTEKLKLNDTNDDTDSESDSESESDDVYEKNINNKNIKKKINMPKLTYEINKHNITFPYNVTCDLLNSVYNKLFTSDEYEKILTNENLRKLQYNDVIYQQIFKLITNKNDKNASNYLKKHYPRLLHHTKNDQFIIINNILYKKPDTNKTQERICIPIKLIHTILEYEHAHNHINHPGTTSMIRLLSNKYYWYKMNEDITNYTKQCNICQFGKGSRRHKVGTLAPLTAQSRGEIVHFDFAGPFFKKISILVMVDHYTGQVVLHPCPNQSAESVVSALLTAWYPRHGLPQTLLTDRGKAFENHANAILYKALGIRKVFTSAYHPQTNAKAERVVQEVKKGLRLAKIQLDDKPQFDKKKLTDTERNFFVRQITVLLPAIEFAINQRIHSVTLVSPNMLTYGRNLRDITDYKLARKQLEKLPSQYDNISKYQIVKQIKAMLDLVKNKHVHNYKKYIIYMKTQYDIDKYDVEYNKNDLVAYFVGDRSVGNRKKLSRKYTGPWKVIKHLRPNTVKIINPETKQKLVVHTATLKPYKKEHFTSYLEQKETARAKENEKNKNKKPPKNKNKKRKGR